MHGQHITCVSGHMSVAKHIPKLNLTTLSYKGTLRPNALAVKAFDGSKRLMIREVKLPIKIGSYVFQIRFQVMDINPNYNCFFLGRPWIHTAGAVTSTLHKKLKFVVKDRSIFISGEEDVLISHLSYFWYVEADEEAIQVSFQALEVSKAIHVQEKVHVSNTFPSFSSLKNARMTLIVENPKVGEK